MLPVRDQVPGAEGVGVAVVIGVGVCVAVGIGVGLRVAVAVGVGVLGFFAASAGAVVLDDSTVLINTMHRSATTDPNLVLFNRIITTS